MLLGTLLRDLQNEDTAAQLLVSLGDIVLLADVDAARAPHGETAGQYTTGAVRRFAAHAGNEDWLRLMTALETSGEPAIACLTTMLRWSIKRDAHEGTHASGCSCNGDAGHGHG